MGGNTLRKIETLADERRWPNLQAVIRKGSYTVPELSPQALATYQERVERDGSEAAKSRLKKALTHPRVIQFLRLT